MHGAFADSASWNGVIARLRSSTATSGGREQSAARADRGRRLRRRDSQGPSTDPSSSAATPTAARSSRDAATGLDHVKALVYVAAFLPEEGRERGRPVGQVPGQHPRGAASARVPGRAPRRQPGRGPLHRAEQGSTSSSPPPTSRRRPRRSWRPPSGPWPTPRAGEGASAAGVEGHSVLGTRGPRTTATSPAQVQTYMAERARPRAGARHRFPRGERVASGRCRPG